jgi:uncharacterized membrane protein YphA (DoxX/SURF4 family)
MKNGPPLRNRYNGAMNHSMAHAPARIAVREPAGWRNAASWAAALALAVLFLSSGLWKATDVEGWAVRLTQARVPEALSVAGALFFGVAETVAGVLLLAPRLRRWGAALAGILLIVFLGYFAVNYGALRGQDCSCFPWLKRVVGPGFFAGDGAMLLAAAAAWKWSAPPAGRRAAALICGAVTVFALVSYGVEAARETGTKAPAAITVEGQPYSLAHGRFFLFFFNPQCMHCMDAAKRMSKLEWGETRVVAIPVEQPQFSAQFLAETGLQAAVSTDFASLAQTFGYSTYPFGVALANGREKAAVRQFDEPEPAGALRALGFVK